MVTLCGSFLIRGTWITVEDTCPAHTVSIELYCFWIRELASVVRKTELEKAYKHLMSQQFIELVEDSDDRL